VPELTPEDLFDRERKIVEIQTLRDNSAIHKGKDPIIGRASEREL
jgi:hypothetical protein